MAKREDSEKKGELITMVQNVKQHPGGKGMKRTKICPEILEALNIKGMYC